MPREARAKACEAEIKTLNPAVTPKHTLLSDRAPADALGLLGDDFGVPPIAAQRECLAILPSNEPA